MLLRPIGADVYGGGWCGMVWMTAGCGVNVGYGAGVEKNDC